MIVVISFTPYLTFLGKSDSRSYNTSWVKIRVSWSGSSLIVLVGGESVLWHPRRTLWCWSDLWILRLAGGPKKYSRDSSSIPMSCRSPLRPCLNGIVLHGVYIVALLDRDIPCPESGTFSKISGRTTHDHEAQLQIPSKHDRGKGGSSLALHDLTLFRTDFSMLLADLHVVGRPPL